MPRKVYNRYAEYLFGHNFEAASMVASLGGALIEVTRPNQKPVYRVRFYFI